VDFGNGAEFPDACIGRVVYGECPLTDGLQLTEFGNARTRDKPTVEEGLGHAEDDLAVNIVLDVFGGLVAAPHGPGVAEARQVGDLFLCQVGLKANAIDGLDMAAF